MADQDPPPDAVPDPQSTFGVDDNGAEDRFKILRDKLVFFFEKRRCKEPEELAQETLVRLFAQYGENVEIRDITRYSYGIAKNVLQEHWRRVMAEQAHITGDEGLPEESADEEWAAHKERRLKCLEECVKSLSPQEQKLLTDYFDGKGRARQERRRRMAEQLHLTLVALRLRIFHLRERLQTCIDNCLDQS
jgi:DNA-directed RNA polymerase specialized sigma24 family protein